jgi:hypothetical protein
MTESNLRIDQMAAGDADAVPLKVRRSPKINSLENLFSLQQACVLYNKLKNMKLGANGDWNPVT